MPRGFPVSTNPRIWAATVQLTGEVGGGRQCSDMGGSSGGKDARSRLLRTTVSLAVS